MFHFYHFAGFVAIKTLGNNTHPITVSASLSITDRATSQKGLSPWPCTKRNLPFGLESLPAPTIAIPGFTFFLHSESQTLSVPRTANFCIFNITLMRFLKPFSTHCWAWFQITDSSVSFWRDCTLFHALTPLTSLSPGVSLFSEEVAAGGHLWKFLEPSSFGTVNHLPSQSQL